MEIHRCALEARTFIAHLLGTQATLQKKVKVYPARLEALGWVFDLRYNRWFVAPKEEKLLKLFYFLFVAIPPTATTAVSKDIEILAGLLNWYMAALPLGRCFTHSLFQLGHYWSAEVTLSPMAQRDLAFWRALVLVAFTHIELVGAPISSLRRGLPPSRFVHTDASTGVGGGGFLSAENAWSFTTVNYVFVLRWSPDELDAITLLHQRAEGQPDSQMISESDLAQYMVTSDEGPASSFIAEWLAGTRPVNINVLEFASAVYALLLWAHHLCNRVVDVGTDNTACLCWLIRQKARSVAADRLLKIMAMMCSAFNIRLQAHFIRGVDNLVPDFLSRDLEWSFMDDHAAVPGFQGTSAADGLDPTLSHQALCRIVLHRALVSEEPIAVTELYATLNALQRTASSVDISVDPRLEYVLDGIALSVSSPV
jgi:hypothetical protein